MPRPCKSRKLSNPPKMKGFHPFGIAVCEKVHVIMQCDEYETIKLLNYDKLTQLEAAERMEISQPTLTRIYNSALTKMAIAFVEGKSILIEGGNFEYEKEWFKCNVCHKLFDETGKNNTCAGCQQNGRNELVSLTNSQKPDRAKKQKKEL